MNLIKESLEREANYFINKVKGALMYRGGAFEGKDLSEMNAKDFIYSCFQNGVKLDCIVSSENYFPWG